MLSDSDSADDWVLELNCNNFVTNRSLLILPEHCLPSSYLTFLRSGGNIERLTLDGTRISPQDLRSICEFVRIDPHIASLKLLGITFDSPADGAESLSAALSNTASLAQLVVYEVGKNSFSFVSPRFCQALAESIVLEELDMQLSDLDEGGVAAVSSAVRMSSSIHTFSLSHANRKLPAQTDTAVCTMCEVLTKKRGTPLRTLDLDIGSFSPEAAKTLADTIARNRTLTALYLRNTFLEPETAAPFCRALGWNKTLEILSLTGSALGEEDAEEIAKVIELKKNALAVVDLSGCGIENAGGKALLRAAKTRGASLPILILAGNKFTEPLAKELGEYTIIEEIADTTSSASWEERCEHIKATLRGMVKPKGVSRKSLELMDRFAEWIHTSGERAICSLKLCSIL